MIPGQRRIGSSWVSQCQRIPLFEFFPKQPKGPGAGLNQNRKNDVSIMTKPGFGNTQKKQT